MSEHLGVTTSQYVFCIAYDDGGVDLNGRHFSCESSSSIDRAKEYLQGIQAAGVIYRLPGVSGNLLEPDAVISLSEALEMLEEKRDQL